MKTGWTIKKLGEVCEVLNGGTPKTGVSEFWGGQHHWITPAEMGKRLSPYVSETDRQVTDAGLGNSSAKLVPPMSVIMSSRAPIGHLVINTIPMAFNQGCKGLVPKNILHYKFLYYYLLSKVELLDSLGIGATFKELSGAKLKEVPIPIPPLQEQVEIAELLDMAFNDLANAVKNAEKNHENAKKIFDDYLESSFKNGNKEWVATTLGEEYDVRDGTHDSPKYQLQGYPLVTSKNLKRSGLDLDDVKLISESDYLQINVRSRVDKGDVLFAMIGTIGNPTVVDIEPNFSIKNVALFKVNHLQSSNFLKYYLDSRMVMSRMMKDAKGATQKFVGLGYLRGFPILIPPIKTQEAIVEKLDWLSLQTKMLEKVYQEKSYKLNEFKKSILHCAFQGLLNKGVK
jgi:type I restriction enzyme, S subunit